MHRLRQRYRELLRIEIAHTVNASKAIDDEIPNLFCGVQLIVHAAFQRHSSPECATFRPMANLVGIVQKEHPEDMGRVVFMLSLDNGDPVPCRSGAGYKSAKPKKGDRVALIGERKQDFRTGRTLPEFIYYELEILSLVPA